MHRKRSLIRVITRLMYASGFIFLISGLLLSAANSPAAAAGAVFSGDLFAGQPLLQDTAYPICPGCETATSPAPTDDPGSSSLVFSSGCHCSCEAVFATVCNVGAADMVDAVAWELYFSASGNPSLGQVVDSGTLGPLAAGQCVDLYYPPNSSGFFAYRVEQEPSGAGPSVLWSNSCMVSGACFAATATATPFLPATETPTGVPSPGDTPTPTETGTPPAVVLSLTPTNTPDPAATGTPEPSPTNTPDPTATATAGPTFTPTTQSTRIPFNLSFVCGYAGDDYLLWWVSNNTASAVDYTWQVSGSSESGSGAVAANSVDYFTTSTGQKTVELFINGELIDTAVSDGPCKEYMNLSYVCADDELIWYASNPNDFAVDYTFTVNGADGSRGVLPANGQVELTRTPAGEHTVVLTWTDTRPGTHSVSLTSDPDACDLAPTATATATATLAPPPVEISPSPTATNTPQPPPPATATNTPQPPPPATATNTAQPPPPATATNTALPPPTNTPPVAPTVTNTPVTPVVITATNSSTPPFIVITNTPTNTVPPVVSTSTSAPTSTAQPPIVITATNSPTPPSIVVTNTPTNTPAAATATSLPAVTVVTNTPTITPTAPTPTLITPLPQQLGTPTEIATLAPPVPTLSSTPVLIPVTGADTTGYGMAVRLSLLGRLLTNAGLVILGMALALTGIQSQLRRR